MTSLMNTLRLHLIEPTFLGLEGAADELDSGEDVDAAGQQHGEALHPHSAVAAGPGGGPVPLVEVPASGLVVDVVEQTVLRDQEGVALERSGCRSKLLFCCKQESLKRRKEKTVTVS